MSLGENFMSQQSLVENFLQYFKVIYACTPELEGIAHRIRYQVYCEEFGFENPLECLDGYERDEMDVCAEQALLIHVPTGDAVGCTRLIGSRGLPSSGVFPFEQHCAKTLDQETV